MGRARAVVALVLAVLGQAAVTACGGPTGHDVPRTHLGWRPASLPAPPGARALPRAATWCAGRWLVVGATAVGDRTRPAVWSSADGLTWRTVPLDPGADYYAARAVLGSVACSNGRVAALGAKPGGAHGLPRTATWRERPDGSLAAVRASYLLYGGTDNVEVSRLVGGPHGYLIAGTRTSGAAVWWSATGASFRLYAGAPGLASTPSTRTQAADGLPVGQGWLVSGDVTGDDGQVRGEVWAGDRGGPWHGQVLPGATTLSTAERLVAAGAGPEVAGLLDGRFGRWVLRGGRWVLADRFGARNPDGTAAAYVSGLASTGSLVAATYSDGARFRLWLQGADPPLPLAVPVSGDHTVTLAGHGSSLLLLTDDGHRGQVWLTHVGRVGGR